MTDKTHDPKLQAAPDDIAWIALDQAASLRFASRRSKDRSTARRLAKAARAARRQTTPYHSH